MEIIQFIFSGFWVFVGVLILITIPLQFIVRLIHLRVRANTIRKVGYPPAHCDGDGDFKKEEQ